MPAGGQDGPDLWSWPEAEMWAGVWDAATTETGDDPDGDALRRAIRDDRLTEYWADRDVRKLLAGLPRDADGPTLDQIPWHAFGYAELIPNWLRQMVGEDADVAGQALSGLWECVRHQGGVSAGAPLVVPFLLRAAVDPATHRRADVLLLAAEAGRRNHFGTDRRGDLLNAAEPGPMIDCDGYPVEWSIEAARQAIAADATIVVGLLDDPDPLIRSRASYALAAALPSSPAFVDALDARLSAETDPAVRVSLILGRAQLAREAGDPTAVPWAHRLWSDPAQPMEVRFGAAIGWLCLIDEPAPAPLLDLLAAAATPQLDEVIRRVPWPDQPDGDGGLGSWLTRLLNAPNEQVALVVRLAGAADASARASACQAAYELARDFRTVTPAMVALLADRSTDSAAEVRLAAMRHLGRVGQAAASVADRLAEHLTDADTAIRAWAATGLAHCGDERAVGALIELLAQPNCPWGRSTWAHEAPSRLVDRLALYAAELLPAIVGRLRDVNDSWRSVARDLVRGLGNWGEAAAGAVPALTDCLTEPWAHRATVATTLGRIGTAAATAGPALAQLADTDDDQDLAVLTWAHWRVTGDGTDAAAATLARLAATPPYGPEALRWLADLGPAARVHVDTIRAGLSDGYEWVRVEAAHALWRCNGQLDEALPVLLRHVDRVEQPWTFWPVQISALEYLGLIGPPAREAVPTLEALLENERRVRGGMVGYDEITWDEHCQEVATTALARIGTSVVGRRGPS
ncbi:HEAT repeat domain-containing protein [Micromonospora sp. NPDC000018]|uniref:HEAT repeat domain-containing protein n=1 Tax=Micromonospora sp. NPDC000018 TaxID=3154239 RepID=UPI00332E3B2C